MKWKISYILKDPRMPHFLANNYIKKKRLLKITSKPLEKAQIKLALTFDIEYDFGITKPSYNYYSVEPFLKKISKILSKQRIVATFFIQGSLISKFASYLRELVKQGHELGLHGFNHELWGYDWFTQDEMTSLETRKRAIEQGIAEFKKNGLPLPQSFRAPYMIIDNDSIKLLKEYGFKVDSSYPSYKGILPIMTKFNDLTEVPVTVNPIPKLRFNKLIPYSQYEVFNLANLLLKRDNELPNYIKEVINIQRSYQQEPYLVFLAHSWEFEELPNPPKGCEYASKKNYFLLFKKIALIRDRYLTNFFRISELI